MPRGRHRHSPPLHKLLPSSAIAGVSVACAAGTWFSVEPVVLRGLAVGAAVAAVVGSVVMRSWDRLAGRQVADLVRARESDGWAHEERVAELEADLDESRELRHKLEQKLRAKRTELAGLRNEHAALLRRYATAETERASALEGRRLLAIEASPAGPSEGAGHAGHGSAARPEARPEPAPEPARELTPEQRLPALRRSAEAARARSTTPPVSLFLRANAALELLARGAGQSAPPQPERRGPGAPAPRTPESTGPRKPPVQRKPAPAAESGRPAGSGSRPAENGPRVPAQAQRQPRTSSSAAAARQSAGQRTPGQPEAGRSSRRPESGQPGSSAGDGGDTHERPAGDPQPETRYTKAPAAAAVVVPPAPARPALGGGFDFFGNKVAGDSAPSAESAHNTGLADAVGQTETALHKDEAEAAFKPASEAERGVGQVIDLTAHDETEQLDVTGLRDAVS
ncbi:hypothetical protein [Streptomyces sp. TS71-3]|uniref:hypothetical protein n=1 Tax=Streptomyces sp. TS71-3 TaxID=2733862 RepID=UPI001B1BBDE1|nr:hypothetical protein [Streptomyces sp. TS71-3]GHJ34684.1 hypothetical protein Sm713_02930 [Streptomyces sp. TS71-3]